MRKTQLILWNLLVLFILNDQMGFNFPLSCAFRNESFFLTFNRRNPDRRNSILDDYQLFIVNHSKWLSRRNAELEDLSTGNLIEYLKDSCVVYRKHPVARQGTHLELLNFIWIMSESYLVEGCELPQWVYSNFLTKEISMVTAHIVHRCQDRVIKMEFLNGKEALLKNPCRDYPPWNCRCSIFFFFFNHLLVLIIF